MKQWVPIILKFWFEETTPQQKFMKDLAFDTVVKTKFEPLYWSAMKAETEVWRDTPDGRLAEVIVLDQFSRNIFRNDKQAFAGDHLALELAKKAVEVGADMEVDSERRFFFYLPFMHSESKEVHEEALKLFEEKSPGSGLEFEIKHKVIIDQFGRYPHRNAVLGRESTPAEEEFLKTHSGF
jgi:uncharacterized protein (DUF924 family)